MLIKKMFSWKKKNEINRFKKNAGLIPHQKNDSIVIDNFRNSFRNKMNEDFESIKNEGFNLPLRNRLEDLPLSRLSDDALQKILAIIKDDITKQSATADEWAENNQLKLDFDKK